MQSGKLPFKRYCFREKSTIVIEGQVYESSKNKLVKNAVCDPSTQIKRKVSHVFIEFQKKIPKLNCFSLLIGFRAEKFACAE